MLNLNDPLSKHLIFKNVNGDIGIELEVEGSDLKGLGSNFWATHEEHSLRNGLEYVSRPLKIEELKPALLEWSMMTSDCKFKTQCLRTSTHIHINAQKHTFLEVYTFLSAYWLLENVLVRINGKEREGNLFCLRVKDAEGIIVKIIEEINMKKPFKTWSNDFRYAALNISALLKFGTFEFRFIRGLTTADKIELWASELYHAVHRIKSRFSSPQDVYNFFTSKGPEAFFKACFSEKFSKEVFKYCPEYKELMEENLVYVYEIISALSNFTSSKKRFQIYGSEDINPDESPMYSLLDEGSDEIPFDPFEEDEDDFYEDEEY